MSGDSNSHARRGSVTTAAFTNLFHRSNSVSASNGNGRESALSASARDQRRRLSVTTLGLGPTQIPATSPFNVRRGSISTTSSDAIDENAVEEDEYAKNPPNTPFTRRMSFGAPAMLSGRPVSGSPNDTGYNWSEQLRSRAESSVSGVRPSFGSSFSSSPPRTTGLQERAKSVTEMPAPPQQAAAIKPKQTERRRPDAMQERILKGDFYMD
ncbi:hypothetical protein MN608_06802 [Microdochium nivale]|nr:hypothetical protein MN608_06802 [Microdochium nivale]